MAVYRLRQLPLLALIILSACDTQKPEGQSQPRPVVEVTPETKAIADVDARATLAFKQDLMTQFADSTTTPTLEAGLTKDGFSCGPNPAAKDERACLHTKRDGDCEINKIVRSQPYRPEKAQVIRICDVGGAAPAQ
jgi:hypothetical protein